MKKNLILIALSVMCLSITAPAHLYGWPLYGWTRLLMSLPIIYAGINFRRTGSITIALLLMLIQGPLAINELKHSVQWGIDFLAATISVSVVAIIAGHMIRREREISSTIGNAHLVMRKMHRTADENALLESLEQQFRERAETPHVSTWLFDEDGRLRPRHGSTSGPLPFGHIFYSVARERRFMVSNVTSEDKRITYTGPENARGDVRQFAVFPIEYSGAVRGVICLANAEGEHFGRETVSFLEAIKRSVENTLEIMERRRGKIRHEVELRRIRSTFTSYVSRTVAEEILKDPDRLELGGETRDVTVMFTEVTNFAGLLKTLDPAEMLSMLNEYFAEVSNAVFDHDGTLDKFIGDNVMAFWGAPLPAAGAADRALLCARTVHDSMLELNSRWAAAGKPQFNVSIGINSGPVVAGNIGSMRRMEYTVIGDTVNVAARIKSLSSKQSIPILVSQTTRDASSGDFNFSEPIEATVKGKSGAITVFRLM